MATNAYANFMNKASNSLRPLNAQLELTYKCNLLCSFCYNAPQGRQELTGEQWLQTLDKCQAAGMYSITLTGGEAFMHRDFWKIAQGVRDRGMMLRVYTNGLYLADRDKAERYAALAPFDTEISIHGSTAAVHERLTGIKDSFDKLLIALGHMRDLDMKVSLKTPITRLNQHQLQDIDELADSYGYSITYDTNITPTDDGDTSALQMAADREFMVNLFMEQAKQGRLGLKPRQLEKESHNCGTGLTTVTMNPYGDIFPCIAWRRVIANILEVDDLLTLWQTSQGDQNGTLKYVREVASEIPTKTLVHAPEGRFAAFCPGAAERETGNPFDFYGMAKSAGATKLEAYRRMGRDEEALKPESETDS